MSRILLTTPLLFVLACQAGEKAPEKAAYPAPQTQAGGQLVAQVGPVKFTTAEIEARIAKQSKFAQVRLSEAGALEEFVEKEVRLELLAQEGWRRGYADSPEIQAQVKRLVVQRVMNEELERLGGKLKLTDADVQAAYEKRSAEFNKPEKIRLSHIQRRVSDGPDKKKELALINGLKTKLTLAHAKKDHQAFANAAQQHSEDSKTKSGGGDLQFMTKAELTQRVPEAALKAVFGAPIGSHHVVEHNGLITLYKVTGRRRGVARTLEQVKPQVRGQLLADRRNAAFDEFVGELSKQHGVQTNEAGLKAVKIDTPKGAPNAP